MATNYKFMLFDEEGFALRKFASRTEAQPYLTNDGMKLVPLPKQPSTYQLACLTLQEAPF
jgi:hypothetical protein